jgi:hypothetical protein
MGYIVIIAQDIHHNVYTSNMRTKTSTGTTDCNPPAPPNLSHQLIHLDRLLIYVCKTRKIKGTNLGHSHTKPSAVRAC